MSPESDWYEDPGDSEGLRWWTGNAWTKHTLPADAIAAHQPELAPFAADGQIRVAPPIRLAAPRRPRVPRQSAPPRIESTATPAGDGDAKPVEPQFAATPSSVTLLPESDSARPEQRNRRRRSKQK